MVKKNPQTIPYAHHYYISPIAAIKQVLKKAGVSLFG
jgi:hypothetical protein